MRKRCRHAAARPWIHRTAGWGFLWCFECGAIRTIKARKSGSFAPDVSRWLYPRGTKDVLRQIERQKDVEVEP